MFYNPRTRYLSGLCLLGVLLLSACDAKNSVDPDATFPPGAPPASPAPTLTISQIVAQPHTVLPGQGSVISVTASDGTSTALSYGWYASQGTVNASNTNPVTWTAPTAEGDYRVSVDVSNGSSTARAYTTLRVATSPSIQPFVTTVLPGEAAAGDEVRVVGNGFGPVQGASSISIGNAAVSQVVSWSDTEIRARVPSAAVTGAVRVTVNGVSSTEGRLAILWGRANPTNMAVSTALLGQTGAQAVSDNQGGMIVVWEDRRNGNAEIYAQRLNSLGAPLWTVNGVVVCDATGDQLLPSIIPDGAGGAIIVWQDRRNGTDYDIYAQRLDADGVPQWLANGVQLSGASDNQLTPRLATDGANGAIVAWEDRRGGTEYDIYAQRVDGSGTTQWLANGVPVVTLTEHQLTPRVVSDNAGGAIIVWADYRSANHYDIYAQRLNASGAPQWAVNGVPVVNAVGNQFGPSIAADAAGGVVIVWQDYRSNSNFDVYAQRLNASGVAQWAANGIAISGAAGNQVSPVVARSGATSFYFSWEDYRNGQSDIYAQRADASGSVFWNANGLVVCGANGSQALPQLVADDVEGAILVWKDYRSGTTADLYMQRINPLGSSLWTADGSVLSNAAGDQTSPNIVSDGAGGAVVAWEDNRSGNADIYAQGISAGGRP